MVDGDVSKWDVSSATTINDMLIESESFSDDISARDKPLHAREGWLNPTRGQPTRVACPKRRPATLRLLVAGAGNRGCIAVTSQDSCWAGGTMGGRVLDPKLVRSYPLEHRGRGHPMLETRDPVGWVSGGHDAISERGGKRGGEGPALYLNLPVSGQRE